MSVETVRDKAIEQLRSYDLLMGYNTQEGSLILSTLRSQMRAKGKDIEDGIDAATANLMVDEFVRSYFPRNKEDIKAEIKRAYGIPDVDSKMPPSSQLADTVMAVYNDLLFASPALTILDLHSAAPAGNEKKSTYMYRFNLETQESRATNPKW